MADYTDTGLPFIRGVNLAKGLFFDAGFVFVSEQKAQQVKSAIVASGDLVLTRKGTIGQVSMIPRRSRYKRYVISGSQMKARLDPSVAFPEFYYYWFRSDAGQQALLANVSTVGVPSIANSLGTLKGIKVPVPPLQTQQAIVRVLEALDDKIAFNESVVECADELRRLSLADFATKREDLAQRRPLTSFAEFINGRAFTKGATGTGRMVVRIAELNSGPGRSTVYNDLDVPERHLARAGDVLFAWSGSLTVARWCRSEAIINQHIFKVIPRLGVPTWLAYELVLSKLSEFKSIAADKATTMGHIQRRHLEEPVFAPTTDAIPRLHDHLGPLWDRALAAEQESLTLAEMRDTLLPGLMSGAIRVREAEKAVEDAV
ncbi:restriction endonuclease subunit S [Micromonospora peucetia]|uniref:Restriction endonuclease subunit S n=1 Tax=Micromonospora peucetia TaxID=47871 RepID=A0ABZ1ECD4_9ACTN|nr:restriction endonuclease subunit S [Micromonospora peucetia]WSA32174.1 restriction endonuclease subunit S [Micromonospora peucetia]